MAEAQHRIVETNGIRMRIAEEGNGPTVLLCHGFPECWYSWRHQLAAPAAHVPQLRGPIMLPGCDHITQEERPDEVNALMIDFLRHLALGEPAHNQKWVR